MDSTRPDTEFKVRFDNEYDRQYIELFRMVLNANQKLYNIRTQSYCYTYINYTFHYSQLPLLTLRKININAAIAEMIGYLRGFTNAKDFSEVGTNTWFANANNSTSWLANPNRKGTDDLGLIYGAIAKNYGGIDLIEKVIEHMIVGIDDRGEIITFWKPDEFDKGCLRPCMHTHQFSLVKDTLYLTSYQRSCDISLGLAFNSIQCWFLLVLVAHLANRKIGTVTHHITNSHIYMNQLEFAQELITRESIEYPAEPTLEIKDYIQTYQDVQQMTLKDIVLSNTDLDIKPMKLKAPFTA